jgi:hypothetical protein
MANFIFEMIIQAHKKFQKIFETYNHAQQINFYAQASPWGTGDTCPSRISEVYAKNFYLTKFLRIFRRYFLILFN